LENISEHNFDIIPARKIIVVVPLLERSPFGVMIPSEEEEKELRRILTF